MSGFEVYNSAGALTIDSTNKSIMTGGVKEMGQLTDMGYYTGITCAFGNGGSLGFLNANIITNRNVNQYWFQLYTDGAWCFPGAYLFMPGTGRFMTSTHTANPTSGYLDVFNASGNLIWSAASAGTMPRIQGFFSIGAGVDLSSVVTVNTPIANPWFCWSQCPGNVSDDGTVLGYSGIVIKRNSSTSFSLQYINKLQRSYTQAMGNNGINIALASFSGY
ncbi:TPA: hypothetical protein RCG93_004553 [Enterobacter roggenkampii]|uniref:hypothetical protein n=1 Tax=Enterobacter asburiae TaxID=61645 RepID=UPI0027EC5340|nr:hypothetical protein [Enterobacter roggenkampii]